MRRRRKYKHSKQTTLAVDTNTFETLWQAKERFRKFMQDKVTWSTLMEQAVLFLEANYLLPSVKAIRYNPYVYGADCPNCGFEEYPLRRKRKIIWRVTCRKCGVEYIAIA